METHARDRLERLFEQATNLPAHERSGFLRAECGGDESLRRQLEDLLARDAQLRPEFLEPKPPPVAAIGRNPPAGPDPLLGATVASYTIQRVLAAGGMGTVYLAEQAHPRREVALKVMRPGLWSKSAERRFEFEAEVLARLRHPNIAQVYEAGNHRLETGATVSFFAMEYIPNARPITNYAHEAGLTIRQRLELFLQTCDAVSHGHQKGIIHRDLKPGNILVGEEGSRVRGAQGPSEGNLSSPRPLEPSAPRPLVKVIDFGIARATDSDIAATTMHTETGALMGTLAYMSPEQAGGGMGDAPVHPADIDTRSDVYSLGVILYELMTGRMPYDVSNLTIHSAIRVICEQPPTRPSALRKHGDARQSVRGDLEAIILKAIEKDRSKRYRSVESLAADVRRRLSGEPIEARPPTLWTTALRWVARHPRFSVALSSFAVAALMLGSAVFSIRIARSRPARVDLTNRNLVDDPRTGWAFTSGDRATLTSLAGDPLHTWSTSEPNQIRIAKLVDRPAELDGGKVVVLGLSASCDSDYRNTVCVFDASGPCDKPLWYRTIETSTIDALPNDSWPRPRHDPDRAYRSDQFSVHRAWLVDVFDDEQGCPGPEIVVVHQHAPGTQSALRIYDLLGKLLFQAWFDGNISDALWMKRDKLLICLAIKGDLDDTDYGLRLQSNHPRVVFAISPRAGVISNGWIYPRPGPQARWDGDKWTGEWFEPKWYRAACPLELLDESTADWWFERSAERTGSENKVAILNLRFPEIKLSKGSAYQFSVELDASGAITRRQMPADAPRRALDVDKLLPKPESFELVDWIGRNPPCGRAASHPTSQPVTP